MVVDGQELHEREQCGRAVESTDTSSCINIAQGDMYSTIRILIEAESGGVYGWCTSQLVLVLHRGRIFFRTVGYRSSQDPSETSKSLSFGSQDE